MEVPAIESPPQPKGVLRSKIRRVAITEGGTVEEIEDREAVAFLGARPDLVRFAVALMQSGRELVRFMWIDGDKSWYAIRIDSERRADDSQRAVVCATAVTPP